MSGLEVREALVVGAGIVGLSAAWYLQEMGAAVTVLESGEVGQGSSWGNAGWLSPGLATPLPEPSVLRHGLSSLVNPRSPLYIPPRVDFGLWRFLLRFASYCTQRQWERAMGYYAPINALALMAYDELTGAGVASPTHAQPILAAYERPDEARPLLHEVEMLAAAGQELRVREVPRSEVAVLQPVIGPRAGYVVAIEDQRYFDPGDFVRALAASVRSRGARLVTHSRVGAVTSRSDVVTVTTGDAEFSADVAVLATGAWLGELGRSFGVRTEVRAGRGYSFSVPTDHPVSTPVYLPAKRIACTPYRGGLRIGGTMEFRPARAPINPVRVDNLIEASRPMLAGVRWDQMTEVWVGSRPVSTDGLPIIGATSAPNVFVSGGHGMWGITLGPISGKLLAEYVVTGRRPAILDPFSPTRSARRC